MTEYSIKHPKDMTREVLEQRVAAHGGMKVKGYWDNLRRMTVESTPKTMDAFKVQYRDLEVEEITFYHLPTVDAKKREP